MQKYNLTGTKDYPDNSRRTVYFLRDKKSGRKDNFTVYDGQEHPNTAEDKQICENLMKMPKILLPQCI